MELVLQQAANGLLVGGSYALVAIGFTLIFGVAGILNLAHADIFMVGAYAGAVALAFVPGGTAVAIVAAVCGSMLAGAAVERFALRPVRGGAFLAPLITSIGASMILQNLAVRIFGARSLPFAVGFQPGFVRIGDIQVSTIQLVMFVVALVLMVGVRLLVSRTAFGRAIRATAEDGEVARLLGIDVNRVILLTIMLGSALAGVAGVTIGASYNTVSPFMGVTFGLKGLVVMIVGGVGSITGAVVGGLLLGVIEALAVGFISSAYRDAVAFGLVLVILLVRPRGLFSARLGANRF
jgi:branched-chain amino acid transport system permease protein